MSSASIPMWRAARNNILLLDYSIRLSEPQHASMLFALDGQVRHGFLLANYIIQLQTQGYFTPDVLSGMFLSDI